MDLALLVLLIASPVGAVDVIYFHLWKFRLFERPQSVNEEITHIIRGFVVPTATLILLLGHPHGIWFWTVVCLFAIDSVNSLLDVVFEPNSRLPRRVPQSELAVHFFGTSMMGAAIALFVLAGWDTRLNASAIAPRSGSFLPDYVIKMGFAGLAGAYGLVSFETFLFIRAINRRRTQGATVPAST